jgi:hypothetical protein
MRCGLARGLRRESGYPDERIQSRIPDVVTLCGVLRAGGYQDLGRSLAVSWAPGGRALREPYESLTVRLFSPKVAPRWDEPLGTPAGNRGTLFHDCL